MANNLIILRFIRTNVVKLKCFCDDFLYPTRQWHGSYIRCDVYKVIGGESARLRESLLGLACPVAERDDKDIQTTKLDGLRVCTRIIIYDTCVQSHITLHWESLTTRQERGEKTPCS